MIEYLVNKTKEKYKLQQYSQIDWIVLHFFFDFHGGKGVTNNFEGLLRSLLYQLIQKLPQVSMLDLDDSENGSFSSCSERTLRDTLRTTLQIAKKGICIFVDGLDEYEGSLPELIEYLRRLVNSSDREETLVKICVSSRPEPVPSQLLQGLPRLFISDHNQSGIQQYCQSTLEELQSLAHDHLDVQWLSRVVAERAEGVFLWARFALEQIILGHSNGETFEEFSKRLDQIPGQIEEIYKRMLDRMEPLAKKECMIMLQLVCFSRRILSWQEFMVATDVAMDKDQVIYERFCCQENYKTFAKRLRAKAVGLLELVGDEQDSGEGHIEVRLIHKSVSTYLNQTGWKTLGGPERISMATHETFYVQICTRYLHYLQRHLKGGSNVNQGVQKDCSNPNGFQKCNRRREAGPDRLVSAYPFLTYATKQIFHHARSLESHGASSYQLLHDALTDQLVRLHVLLSYKVELDGCDICRAVPRKLIFEDFDSCHIAILHNLFLYCKDDLAARLSAPGQVFWNRALRYAIYSSRSRDRDVIKKTLSLALHNVANVQQCHIEDLLNESKHLSKTRHTLFEAMRSVLSHKSVKDLRLVGGDGQEVTLLKFLTVTTWSLDMDLFIYFLKVGDLRGEDLRERCGPEGNVVETLLKQEPGYSRRDKIRLVRAYYESQSWSFKYDSDEVERVFQDKDGYSADCHSISGHSSDVEEIEVR